jgi:hypothetical protein
MLDEKEMRERGIVAFPTKSKVIKQTPRAKSKGQLEVNLTVI